MHHARLWWALVGVAVVLQASALRAESPRPFRIQVVDATSRRGVPLVELTTVNNIQFITDSNGVIAIDDADLLGERVYFSIRSHGYEFPADGFGYRGKALELTPGESAVIPLPRVNIAERLYRVTGSGIYRDSLRTGVAVPLKRPLLNGLVFGQDSVQTALYHGKIHWLWGDTNRPGYLLGNFHVPGATSRLPGEGGLKPDLGIDLEYFLADDGFVKSTAELPGEGPTWLDGLTVLRDARGGERLFAGSMKVKNLLEVYRRGIVEWNDDNKEWKPVADVPLEAASYPAGHAVEIVDRGTRWVHFGRPFPLTRVPANAGAFVDVSMYEAFTCLKEGTTLEQGEVERDAQGRALYGWKKYTPAVGSLEQLKLADRKLLTAEESLIQLRDVRSGDTVLAHAGSTYWNEHRKRWVLIAVQWGGSSVLGEVWYSEADTPVGPWVYTAKIVTHDKYSFYNPKQHPLFDEQGGRRIYFEGTYASTFSGNTDPTPRYDYNQIMYRLDLEDPRLVLPVAIYRRSFADRANADLRPRANDHPRAEQQWQGEVRVTAGAMFEAVEFFAPDRPAPGLVPVYSVPRPGKSPVFSEEPPADEKDPQPLFYAVKANAKDPPPGTVPLLKFSSKTGAVDYSTSAARKPGDQAFERQPMPQWRVWKSPWR